jgi:hypothetical protein
MKLGRLRLTRESRNAVKFMGVGLAIGKQSHGRMREI